MAKIFSLELGSHFPEGHVGFFLLSKQLYLIWKVEYLLKQKPAA